MCIFRVFPLFLFLTSLFLVYHVHLEFFSSTCHLSSVPFSRPCLTSFVHCLTSLYCTLSPDLYIPCLTALLFVSRPMYPVSEGQKVDPVEQLYCKRPIQCLASSKILTPHPLTARRVCNPPPLVKGEDTLAGWRGGGGSIVRKTPDTALYSIYVSTLWLIQSRNADKERNLRLVPTPSNFWTSRTMRTSSP